MVAIADDLLLLILPATTETGPPVLLTSAAGAPIQGQSDEGTSGKSLITLGSAEHSGQSLAASCGIQSLGEIPQRVIAKRSVHQQGSASPESHQRLDAVKGAFPKQLAQKQRPQQCFRRNLRVQPSVSGRMEKGS